MFRSENIALKDIRPDENNPRQSFDGLEELAESFNYTPDRPGEPFTPLIVVKDGNIYRIVDGERRYRAMLKAGKVDKCLCNVADTFEEAHSVAMMFATDNKEELNSAERAMGVQTMLCLGVDFDTVDSLGKLKKGSSKQIKKMLNSRRDHAVKPVQIGLNPLLEIANIENPNRMGELIELWEKDPEAASMWKSDFQKKKDDYIGEAKAVRGKKYLQEAFNNFDFEILDEEPEDGSMYELETIYASGYKNPDSIKEEIDVVVDDLLDGGYKLEDVSIYIKPGRKEKYRWSDSTALFLVKDIIEKEDDPEQLQEQSVYDARKQLDKQFVNMFKETRRNHFIWACENFDKVRKGSIGKYLVKRAKALLDKDLKEILEKYHSVEIIPEEWMLASFWPKEIESHYIINMAGVYFEREDLNSWEKEAAEEGYKRWRNVLQMLTKDGYEPDDFERELEDTFETWLNGVDDNDAEDEVSGEDQSADAA